jgi:predicted secreted protein
LPYSPDEEATEVLTIVADIVLVLVVLGLVHALLRKLCGQQKKKEWTSTELETPYQNLDY